MKWQIDVMIGKRPIGWAIQDILEGPRTNVRREVSAAAAD
jgi:hypothetical protein